VKLNVEFICTYQSTSLPGYVNHPWRGLIHSPQQKSQTRQQLPPKQRCSDQTPKEKRIAQTIDEQKKRCPELVLKGRYLYRTLYPPAKKTLKGLQKGPFHRDRLRSKIPGDAV